MPFAKTLIIALLLLSPLAYAERVSFTFAYDVQEGFPSFMGNGKNVQEEMPGTYIEILRLVEKRVPIKLELVRYPWERCKAYLKTNKVDGINSSFRIERQMIGRFPQMPNGEVDVSRRITSDTYQIYAKKGSPIFFDPHTQTVKNIENTLVAPMGYSIVSDLRKNGVEIDEVPTGVVGILKMLAYDRVSGVIAHHSQARHVLSQDPQLFHEIEAVQPAVREKAYFILISKEFYRKHPQLAEQIWQVIGELRETHLPSIMDKYMRQNNNA